MIALKKIETNPAGIATRSIINQPSDPSGSGHGRSSQPHRFKGRVGQPADLGSKKFRLTLPRLILLGLFFAGAPIANGKISGNKSSTETPVMRINDRSPEDQVPPQVPLTSATCQDPVQDSVADPATTTKEPQSDTRILFDGKTLENWKATNFGGEGECLIEDGLLILEPGFPLTGITSTIEDLPTVNYEIELEIRKTEGIDFFCGLTFPFKENHCSLIVGGWAGPVVGLSQIDGQDAANNETKRLVKFEQNRWYRIRLQVRDANVSAWIDDQQVVDFPTEGRRLSVRNETLPSQPLGICNFETRSEIRSIKLRLLAKVPATEDSSGG